MEITLEITQECALKCDMCSSSAGLRGKDELSTDDWIKVIQQCKKIDTSEICISGGEPFLRSDLIKIVEQAKKCGMRVVIYTSGNIFNSKTGEFKSLARKDLSHLADYVDRLAVGLHGSNAAIHDSITNVNGSFSRLRETVANALSLGIPVTGHFVPIKPNYYDIQNTVRIAMIMGLSRLGILRFVPQGRGRTNQSKLELNEAEIEDFGNFIRNMKADEKKFIRIGAPFCSVFLKTSARCSLGKRLTIQPNGILAPCEALKDYVNDTAKYDIRSTILGDKFLCDWIDSLLPKSHPFRLTNEACIAQVIQNQNSAVCIVSEKKKLNSSH